MYLWRAVDSKGEVLDILVQRGRDKTGHQSSSQVVEAERASSAGDRDRQAAIIWRCAP
jgi:hypothetical protein